MKLQNQTAIVTGGAMGIGAAIVRLFTANGARVVIADIADEPGNRLAQELRQQGSQVHFIHTDVSQEREIQAALDWTEANFGTPDILVNDAAIQLNKALLDTTLEEFEHVLAVNLTGAFLFLRDTAKRMIAAQKNGVIVNFSSTFAFVGSPGYLAYHASKGGIASLTRAAAIALMPHNIRVNAVAPGTVETPGLHDGARDTGDLEAGLESFRKLQPLKRFGTPEEIAQVVLFLASADSSFVYGANWLADGGYTVI